MEQDILTSWKDFKLLRDHASIHLTIAESSDSINVKVNVSK